MGAKPRKKGAKRLEFLVRYIPAIDIYVLYIDIDILDIFLDVSDTRSLDLQDKQNPLIHQRPNRFPKQKQGSAQTGFGCKNMTWIGPRD